MTCTDEFSAPSTRHCTPYILLNTRKTGERGRFDAAHELGHLVLHSGYQSPRGPEAEAAADAFASAFLMPRAGILAQQVNNASVERILSAKGRWGVSAMAFSYRLRTMKLLSEWRFQQTAKQLAQLGYRKGEPGSSMVRESSKLISKVFEALRAEGTSVNDLAKSVHIFPEELNHYVFGLVPIGYKGGEQRTAPIRPALSIVK
ncbi:ImmA/IrrE family metallo-endopeptidase [Streptomyces sp. NPDC056231]|uniref:ImmA/IrrE family metallo-endopeptidase n=1 Tax=Streptomyces sp. NPDC056231 TaxID=3345755 RepID=UPI003AACF9CA